jgi:hypothetical protein
MPSPGRATPSSKFTVRRSSRGSHQLHSFCTFVVFLLDINEVYRLVSKSSAAQRKLWQPLLVGPVSPPEYLYNALMVLFGIGLTALVLGATGATGKHVLREVLLSERFSRVGEYGRSLTPESSLPAKEKLQQQKIDFESLDSPAIKQGDWNVVFIA